MKGVILAGGKGTRFEGEKEKQLKEVGDKKLIDRVLRALKDSALSKVFIAVSDNSPNTWKYCKQNNLNIIETEGESYHKDLKNISKEFNNPFLTAASDIPFITTEEINKLIKEKTKNSLTLITPKFLVPRGFKIDNSIRVKEIESVPCGINIVGKTKENEFKFTTNPLAGININTKQELNLANNIIKLNNQDNQKHKINTQK
ncbi:MAG: GTP:adenosylcobinamide-phosphate guanylyltransferase [Candidatus Methanohalarchaeum thermophilum]|uniref:GTP:adenosylcobinamide-phosphate guanylyltransferase n=1 Tax=Methanohalarchaeum thermophilum TaxID=1903181 RepID=A0A1Q6DU02_METT1|nr:MAG: GTP:adenosylcobinamide-phosphate guanylyltransferase [Candidatus Methanohalarchaeum thermophilum]